MSWNKKSLSNDRRKPAYNRGTNKHDTASLLREAGINTSIYWDNDYDEGECFCVDCQRFMGPTMVEVNVGRLVNILDKLEVRAAKEFLKGWYW